MQKRSQAPQSIHMPGRDGNTKRFTWMALRYSPQHPPAALGLVSSFHTCSTTGEIMQQDWQLGIPPPFPCLAFLSLSVLSFFFTSSSSSSLSLSPSSPSFYPGVTDYYSADGCSGGCRKMTHNTSKLVTGTPASTRLPPPPPPPPSIQSSSLRLHGDSRLAASICTSTPSQSHFLSSDWGN